MNSRRLIESAQRDREEFDDYYHLSGGCSCHICPPCSFCTHPGNPLCQEECDECWEEDNLFVRDLHPTQDGFRHSPKEVLNMIRFVNEGGRFNTESLNNHDPEKHNPLVAVTQFEDGSLYIRDGFHRVMSIFIGRTNGVLYHDEYFLENLTYNRMMTPNLKMRYYTPFDPRIEVRASDFGNFITQVEEVIQNQKDPLEFIQSNREIYVRSKQSHHESVELFANRWLKEIR